MKETFLEKLARRQKDKRKRNKEFEDKYWKLSSQERMEYDNKIDRIKKMNHWGLFPLAFTLLKWMVLFGFGILLLYFVSNKNSIILDYGFLGSVILFALFRVLIVIDLLLFAFYLRQEGKEIIELKKRFRLIKEEKNKKQNNSLDNSFLWIISLIIGILLFVFMFL